MRIAPLLLLAILLTAAVAAAEAEGGVHVVELRPGGHLYVVKLNVSMSRYVTGSSVVELAAKAEVVYSTLNESIVLVGDVYLGNVSLGSMVLAPLAPGKPSTGRLVAPVPPQALQQLGGAEARPAFLRLVLKAYLGNSSDVKTLLVPVVLVEEEPGVQVLAAYGDGSASTVAVAGRDLVKKIYVRVVNTGMSPVDIMRLRVAVGGRLVYQSLLAERLGPGQQAEKVVELPVPQEPGAYGVNVTASGVCSGSPCTGGTLLRLYVLPPITVSAVLMNQSVVVEGENLCLRIVTYPEPGIGKPILLLEERPVGAPSWTPVAQGKASGEAVLCTAAPGTPPGRETVLEVRARLVVLLDGLEYSVASSPVQVRILPMDEVLRGAALELAIQPTRVYLVERLHASLSMTPSLSACIPALVEAFNGDHWEPVAKARLCGGQASLELEASKLGTGRHLVRATVEADGRRLTSPTRLVEVYPLPALKVKTEPSTVAPGSMLRLIAALDPALHPLRVSVYVPWLDVWVNTTSPGGEAVVPLEAPDEPGQYPIQVIVTSGDYRAEKNITVTVAPPRLIARLEPSTVAPGEKTRLSIRVEPPLSAKIRIAILKGGKMLWNRTLYAANGTATAVLTAPKEPGNYTITVGLEGFNATATATLKVTKPSYRIRLTLNATRVPAGAPVRAIVEITPPPRKPVAVAILAASEANTSLWKTLGALNVGPEGRAGTVIHAPSQPGAYQVKASSSVLNAESPPARLEVVAAATAAGGVAGQPVPAEAVMVAAAAIAVVWSFRSLRRR